LFKTAKDRITAFVPPGGSSSAARRFMEETQNLVKIHVPPGDNSCAARQFLEKSRKCEQNKDLQIFTVQA